MANRTSNEKDQEVITLVAVGDNSPVRDNPEFLFTPSAHVLKDADITFGQLENLLSDRGVGQFMTTRTSELRVNPKNVAALTFAGFDVISFTANHGLDFGFDAFLDTIDILRQNNIIVIGAGKNLAEARKPAIIERKGTRLAFLAYSSVPGYVPPPDKPSIALMRASTFYQQVDPQPGTPPNIITIPDKGDLEALKDDIKKVKPLVDLVIVSMHWGVHFLPVEIPMYEWEVGHAAIDAGADLIIGGHPHILKGIEVYKGKVIFHSLGNFGTEVSGEERWKALREALPRRAKAFQPFFTFDPDYPTYPYMPEARNTIIVKCIITNKKIQKVSFLPCLFNKQGQVEILHRESENFDDVVRYVREISEKAGLDTKFRIEGDEVFLIPA